MSPETSRADILNREFQQLLKLALRSVAVLLPIICVLEALSAENAVDWGILAYDLSVSLLLIAGALIAGHRLPPAKWSHPIAFGVVVLLQISTLLTLHLQEDMMATGNVGVILIASGFFFLSTYWYVLVLVLCLTSWGTAMFITFHSGADILGMHSIFAAAIAGVMIHATRVNTTLRLDQFHAKDATHRRELAEALESAEKEIAVRRQIEEKLVRRVEIERLISSLSSRFINLRPGDLDTALNEALAELGQATEVDRTYIFQFSEDLKLFRCTHEWCAPGIDPYISELQNLSVSQFPWVTRSHLEGRTVHIPRIAELPPEAGAEKAEFSREGIKSMLALTLKSASAPLGFMGFDSVRNEKVWREDMISLMGVVAEIVVGALERRAAEEALTASEARYRVLADNTLDVIWRTDADLHPSYIAPSIKDLLGYSSDEIMKRGSVVKILDPASFHESPLRSREEALAAIDRLQPGEMIELRLFHKDGHPVWTESTLKLLRDADGNLQGVQGTTRDISARKTIEEEKAGLENQLLQSQKMEAIGTLAGGIAHDFNNLLTGILGYANLLKLENEPDTETFQSADVIEKAAERAAQLTRQLLGFARKGKFRNTRIDVHETIQEVIMLLTRTIGKNIEITSELRAHHPFVSGDPTQVQQIILNIAVNARDAMPEGGELRFQTEDLEIGTKSQALFPGLRPGQYFRLRVSDTGDGIPESIRPRVFEPFFTTKEPGKGTGMGLATAYGIVKNHGGLIQVESKAGQGTSFDIYLPSLESKAREITVPVAPSYPNGATARILMIDDESLICNIASAMLTRLGYAIETFTEPEVGLDAYRKNPPAYDLVILDVIMPKLDGMACLQIIRGINPDQRILLSSGFERGGAIAEAMKKGDSWFVQKPYKLEALAKVVSEALMPGPATPASTKA